MTIKNKKLKNLISNIEKASKINREDVKKAVYYLLCDGMPLTEIADSLGINRITIYKLAKNDKEFAEALVEARKIQMGTLVDEALEVARDTSGDLIERDGDPYPNAANVAARKLLIGTIFKISSFYYPEMFGEKSQVDITSQGQTVFTGLTITPPKIKDEKQ